MNYRNPRLLRLAKEAPYCFRCNNPNHGNVVSAHSNSQRHGKGMGIKAHDFQIAMLCSQCHIDIDRGKHLSREQSQDEWQRAHDATLHWLFSSGRLKVA